METILEINGLSKSYKDVKALNQLTLKVEKGMVFGLLGPNGSGKTTTLGILLGVIRHQRGLILGSIMVMLLRIEKEWVHFWKRPTSILT